MFTSLQAVVCLLKLVWKAHFHAPRYKWLSVARRTGYLMFKPHLGSTPCSLNNNSQVDLVGNKSHFRRGNQNDRRLPLNQNLGNLTNKHFSFALLLRHHSLTTHDAHKQSYQVMGNQWHTQKVFEEEAEVSSQS